jgi:DNA topoisomerase-2
MFMADQDTDGSHIKGLLMNFIHHFWPSLIQIRGFLTEFVTPIIKVSKGRNQIQFFTVQDFKRWCDAQGPAEIKSWNIKYYKGLGTSDDDEAKDYFSNL